MLQRFEQARRVLTSGTAGTESGFPMRVLLFSSEREYGVLRPGPGVPAFFQSGPDRDTIVMLAGAETDRVILHEYTHSVLNRSSAPISQWLEEGLAEFYSTLQIGERRATAGAPIPSHLATLAHEKWLSAGELIAVNQESGAYNERNKTGIFYAESWALTHMLMLGERYRGKLPRFLDALATGEAEPRAFADAFEKPVPDALRDLETYVRTGFGTLDVEIPPAAEVVFSDAVPLDTVMVDQARAEVLLLMGRDRQAEAIYQSAASRFPKMPSTQTGLAVIAMRDRDYERARECFERAIQLGAHDSETYFEYGMLLRDTGAAPELVDEFLHKTIAANPAHAEAHFLLGIRANDAGRYSEAVEHLRRALEILPRQAYFWQALSYSYHRLGRNDDSRSAAWRALRTARTDHETAMAREALKLADQAPQGAPRAKRPAVVTPQSWNAPHGDRSVSGALFQVDCEGGGARLHVRTEAGEVVIKVTNAHTVAIRSSEAKRELACGTQTPVPVTVEYNGTSNEVTALEFR